MESNAAVIAKRVWNMVRVVLYMLRKGISKGKLMMDLNMFLKRRGKLAGKAIANLMFHHSSSNPTPQFYSASREYEFSCSNTPNNHHFFFPTIGSNSNKRTSHANFFACAHAPSTREVKAVLDMLNSNNNEVMMTAASPALPGFGRSPKVRQLRVTDSPFPLRDDDKDDHQVDKAAEDFIKRFYKELRKQD